MDCILIFFTCRFSQNYIRLLKLYQIAYNKPDFSDYFRLFVLQIFILIIFNHFINTD